MCRSGMKLPVSILAGMAILLAASGCAEYRLPRIDPSGEHLFIYDPPPATVTQSAGCPCPPGTVPVPAPAVAASAPVPAAVAQPPVATLPRVSPYSDVAAMLSPYLAVQPVGSQVVLVGGVRGGDGYLRTNRRLEWWLMPGSVGQFTNIGEKSFADYLVGDFTRPRVISATSAVGSTTREPQRVTRDPRAGAPGARPGNYVNVVPGQGWVTVSSPVEGVSHVMLVAPDVVLPAERSKSADIYWIDAQFGLPSPAIAPAGTKQSLTTTVSRQSNHCPRPGWIVRYEVACGPAAVFAPTGAPSIEIATNEAGQASAEIVQKDPSPGTSQVRIQVFRPAESGGQRLKVREASVLVTWTAPSLGIRQMGPPTVALGDAVSYRIEISNPGDLPARDVVAIEDVPEGLIFLQATPVPVVEGRRLQWRLGDLVPRQQQIIEATFRTAQQGAVAHCVEVTAAGGLRSSHCASTNVIAPLPGPATSPSPATIPPPGAGPTSPGPTRAAISVLDLQMTPEKTQVVVGSDVTFNAVLTNRGPVPATGLVVRDTFGDGLEHKEKSPTAAPVPGPATIPGDLPDLAAGRAYKFNITFRATKSGQLCHRLEVTAADGAQAVVDSCVTVVLPATGPGPAAVTPPPGTATVTPPPLPPAAARLEIHVSGPTTSTVGKAVVFTAQITNPGQQPLANVVVSQQSDAALVVTQATEGAKQRGNDWVWSLPSVPPGRLPPIQVQCDCKQATSNACCRFTVALANGQTVEGQACLKIAAATPPVGPPLPVPVPGRLDVFVDNINKVTAGKDQQFLVQVTNQGDNPENNIIVTAYLPPGSAVVESGTNGPGPDIKLEKGAGLVRFSPVAELAPKAMISYRVVVTSSKPGPISLQVEATSRRQTQPVRGEKTIEILPAE